MNNVLQHGGNIDSLLGGDLWSVLGGESQDVLDLLLYPLRVGGGQVDLVDYRQDLQIMLHSQISIGQGLGLDALGSVYNKHRSLAGGQRAGHLIVEVHMPRGVDQVEGVSVPVLRPVVQPDSPGLDGDATLLFQVHVVQQLGLHLPLLYRSAQLDEPVRQCRFAVVNVGYDRKVADFRLIGHKHKPPVGNQTKSKPNDCTSVSDLSLAEWSPPCEQMDLIWRGRAVEA